MIRLLLALILVASFLNAKDDINKKISKTNSKMSSFSKNYSNINKKMAKTAKAILRQKKELEKQNKYLKKLKKELGIKESSYKENTIQLGQLRAYKSELKKEQNFIEEELVFVIAQSVSLSVILEEDYAVNAESLIEFEVLKNMLSSSKKRAKKLNKKFYSNSKNIDTLKNHTNKLERAITNIDKKRKKLLRTKKANKKALKKLELSKASYKKELKKLIRKQNALKKTLAQLNIIKIDEAKKVKQEKERKAAFKRKSIVSNENLPKVKKHGSSYQAIKTKRYRGPKTIAPLDSYTMTKKYGTYTDPIYGIKIFNESISLKPRKANSKVKTAIF